MKSTDLEQAERAYSKIPYQQAATKRLYQPTELFLLISERCETGCIASDCPIHGAAMVFPWNKRSLPVDCKCRADAIKQGWLEEAT